MELEHAIDKITNENIEQAKCIKTLINRTDIINDELIAFEAESETKISSLQDDLENIAMQSNSNDTILQETIMDIQTGLSEELEVISEKTDSLQTLINPLGKIIEYIVHFKLTLNAIK